jgi:hypothetical protein
MVNCMKNHDHVVYYAYCEHVFSFIFIMNIHMTKTCFSSNFVLFLNCFVLFCLD